MFLYRKRCVLIIGCLLALAWVPANLHGQRVQLQDFFGSSQPIAGLPIPPNTLPTIPQNFPALPSGVIPNGLPQVGLPQIHSGFPQPVLPQFDGFSPGSVQLPQIVPPAGIGQITPPAIGPSPNFPVFPRVTNPFPNPGSVQVNPATVPGFQAPGFQAPPFRPQAYTQQPFRPDRSRPPAGRTKVLAAIGCQQSTGLTRSNFGRISKTTFCLGYLNGPELGKHGLLATAITS